MCYFQNKSILIVGGTGTVGNGLVKELVKCNPRVIRILSRDEYKQFKLKQNEEFKNNDKLRFLIGDVRDYERIERAMEGIDIVFNLAAMKHVEFCEYNPTEAIKTNVSGMSNVIKAAIKHEVECVLFTSSDKAISPTNTYGATKMLAEKLVQSANISKGNRKTKFIAVRFGNIMGSRGSVIPLFKEQISENSKITLTDPKMSRFMMTLSSAVNLMMEACKISVGGEVFVLKMPVINMKDLSEVVIEELSAKMNKDINDIMIDIIGIKPGERTFEELMTKEESKIAKDIGNMYAVFPTTYTDDNFIDRYRNYKNAEIRSYSSNDTKCISKEEIRSMLINEKLL